MKSLLTALMFLLCLVSSINAQTSIEEVFLKNDIVELEKMLPSSIELSIEDEENIYSKKQAVLIIQKFFTEYPSTEFKIKHESKANKITNNKFLIGNYKSSNKEFRTHFLIHQVEDKVQIIEIRIESEEN